MSYDSPQLSSFPFKGPATPDWAKMKNSSPRKYPSQVRAHHQKKLEKDTATIWHHSDPSMIDITALSRRPNKFSLESPSSSYYIYGILFIVCLMISVTILYISEPDFVMAGSGKDKKICKTKLFAWSLLISSGVVLAVCAVKCKM